MADAVNHEVPPLPPDVNGELIQKGQQLNQQPAVPNRVVPELPPDPWKSMEDLATRPLQEQKPTREQVQHQTEHYLGKLPEGLQDAARGFFKDLAEKMVNQHSNENGMREISPDYQAFYERRMKEVLDSGLFNPHDQTPKITR